MTIAHTHEGGLRMRLSPTHAPRSGRLGRTLPALGVALIAVAVAAAPVGAATYTVRMPGYDFDPQSRTIARGDIVKWKNTGFTNHDVYAKAPRGYFKSRGGPGGMKVDDTYLRAFKSAGTFPYVCLLHSPGMSGTIQVPMKATKSGGRFRLTVASQNLPSSSKYRHVVQIDPPNGGWSVLKTTRNAVVYTTPAARGTYRFRTKVRNTSTGSSSGYSPVVSLTYNP